MDVIVHSNLAKWNQVPINHDFSSQKLAVSIVLVRLFANMLLGII